MKILFLSDNFPPEVNAPANRTYEHCLEWVRRGAEVTVITCAPNFPQGKVYDGYKNKLYQTEVQDGIKVVRVWSYVAANKGTTRRILDYLSFALTAWVASWFHRADLIVATSPQFFAAVAGYLAAFVKRKPWIMEVRDLWPESIKAVDAIRQSRVINWLEKLELFLYRRADKVVVVTDAFKANISGRGIPADKIEVIKNGVQTEQYRPRDKEARLVEELGLQDRFVIGYIGTHGMAHKLDFILECAREAPEDVHFLFIGHGAEKERLLGLREQWRLRNVTMLDPVPRAELLPFISVLDAALVPLRKSVTFKTVIPSKIFENAAMGKPILLGVEGESQEIIESYGAGLCFEPENKEDFLRQVERLRGENGLYGELQAGCAELVMDFDRKKLAERMYGVMVEVRKSVLAL